MIHKILIIIFIFIYIESDAQKLKQDAQLFAYNVGFNGITAGIGAIINKDRDKDHKWYNRFTRGFYQGCIGGALIYSSKKIIYNIKSEKNYWYAWPSKLVHSAGMSIVENAALNNKFGENWNIEIWAFRCDFSIGESSYFKPRLLATSIYSIIFFIPKASFDWNRSLMTGVLFFSGDTLFNGRQGVTNIKAISTYTNYKIYPGYNDYYVTAHELVHTYQSREYQIFNTWLKPYEERAPEKIRKLCTKYIYLDIFYFGLFYRMIGGEHSDQYYLKNFYELESENFARNKFIPVKSW